MAKSSQPIDGRNSLSFLLIPGTEVTGDGVTALAAGDMVIVTKNGTTGVFKDMPPYSLFIAPVGTTLKPTSDEKYVPCTPKFLGFANDKSMAMSKTTNEATMDYDKFDSFVVSDSVNMSGSIGGLHIVQGLASDPDDDQAINIVKSRFTDMVQIDDDGTVTYKAADVTKKDLVLIFWNARSAKVGDIVEGNLVPSIFSNLSMSAANGSTQPFSVDYQGNATDENGYKATDIKVKWTAALISIIQNLIERPAA